MKKIVLNLSAILLASGVSMAANNVDSIENAESSYTASSKEKLSLDKNAHQKNSFSQYKNKKIKQ